MPSDKDRLRQAIGHIDRIKAADYPTIHEGGKGLQIVERPWADMPEPSKLAILQDSVDWSGITTRDQADILLGEVDPGKISDSQRNRLIEAATRDEPVADEEALSPDQMKALMAEWRADEHAARVRDFGEADAATYDARMAEAYRLRGEEYGPVQPPTPPLTEAELQEVERGFLQPQATPPDFSDILRGARSTTPDTRSDFQRLLDEAGERAKASKPKDRELERGGPER